MFRVSVFVLSVTFSHTVSLGRWKVTDCCLLPSRSVKFTVGFFFAVFHISLNIVLFYFALDCNDIRRVGSRQRIGPNVWQELEPSLNVDVKT